ncbi:MAG TPA: pyrroline-5-carboxylate reductase [Geothermobacteraceae bacterium]|nr:pyrroline-5-carboxylate reductase [Geothermobacteraceae bacterium]
MTNTGKIGFVGGGNMAEAILKGVLHGSYSPEQVTVFEPAPERAAYLAESYGVNIAESNRQVVERSDLVVLAVKPQIVQAILPDIARAWTADKLLVSILAGTTTISLEKGFSSKASVVRAMPNTPAMIGAAATAICPGTLASDSDLELARQLFATIGDVVAVSEAQMDAVTGLSGSGPAYIYSVIEALAAGGVAEGLPEEVALKLAAQTVAGAARMVQQSGETPAVLRERVCSPGGTTLAGLQAMNGRGLQEVLVAGVQAATARSRELGKA